MDFGLTPDQVMIADTVRSFVEREIYPHEELVERTGAVPHELGEAIKRKVIDLGFYACNFPAEVATRCGYQDAAAMTRAFVAAYGQPPRTMRRILVAN